MWFWIWTALTLGALAAGFLAWRQVWRHGKGLVRELGTSGDRIGDVVVEATARTDARLDALAPVEVTVGLDPAPLRRAIEDRRARTRAHRARPRPEVWERWAQVWR